MSESSMYPPGLVNLARSVLQVEVEVLYSLKRLLKEPWPVLDTSGHLTGMDKVEFLAVSPRLVDIVYLKYTVWWQTYTSANAICACERLTNLAEMDSDPFQGPWSRDVHRLYTISVTLAFQLLQLTKVDGPNTTVNMLAGGVQFSRS